MSQEKILFEQGGRGCVYFIAHWTSNTYKIKAKLVDLLILKTHYGLSGGAT